MAIYKPPPTAWNTQETPGAGDEDPTVSPDEAVWPEQVSPAPEPDPISAPPINPFAPAPPQPHRVPAPPQPHRVPEQQPTRWLPERSGPLPVPPVEARPASRSRVIIAAVTAAVVLVVVIAAVSLLTVGRNTGHPAAATIPTASARPVPGTSTPDPTGSASTGTAGGVNGPPASATPSSAKSSAASNGSFSDDFTGSSVDLSKWSLYTSTSTNGALVNPSQVTVSGGYLQITGAGNNATGVGNKTGGLCMCPTGNHVYGTWQLRARADAGTGYGPSMGLWPESGTTKDNGYFSVLSIKDPTRKTSTHQLIGRSGTSLVGSDHGDFTAWHTYSIEWRSSYVKMSIDGTVVLNTSTGGSVVIPNTPMHLYMQLLAGPNDGIAAPDSSTPAKVTFDIDWARYAP
jgi:beta-glucanase (GH16 family)